MHPPPPPQVTAEVGQECLGLQERMRGGLLGAGHSWVASPLGGHVAPSGHEGAAAPSAADAAPQPASADAACAVTIKAGGPFGASGPANTAAATGVTAPGMAAKVDGTAPDATNAAPAPAAGNGHGSWSGSDNSEEVTATPKAGLLRRLGRALSRRRVGAK